MNDEISFQQLRTPIAVALTVILNSMFTLPSDARLTDLSKVENPLILASILLIFPLVIWNHPPSLAASGATLLILSVLAHSRDDTMGISMTPPGLYGSPPDCSWAQRSPSSQESTYARPSRRYPGGGISSTRHGWLRHSSESASSSFFSDPQTHSLSRSSMPTLPPVRAPCSSGLPRGYSLPCWPPFPRRPPSSAWLPSSGSTASTSTVRSPPPAPFPSCSSLCW